LPRNAMAYSTVLAVDVRACHVIFGVTLDGRISWIFLIHPGVKSHFGKCLFERHSWRTGRNRCIAEAEVAIDADGNDDESDDQSQEEGGEAGWSHGSAL
jgi:hypothetical protein